MTEKQRFEIWRKKQVDDLTEKLEELLPGILRRHIFYPETAGDLKSQQQSLNAKIGAKYQ